MERLSVLCIEDLFLPEHLYSKYDFGNASTVSDDDVQVLRIIPMKEAVNKVEKMLVTKAMNICKSTRKSAEMLEVSQSTIMRKLKNN